MVKYYYYVNLVDNDVTVEGNEFKVSLNGKSFRSVKVLSSVISLNSETFNPCLKLNTYSGNGFSSDRMSPTICLYNKLVQVDATDWRYSHDETPVYFISESLADLKFQITDGSGNIINPVTASLQFILELDDQGVPP